MKLHKKQFINYSFVLIFFSLFLSSCVTSQKTLELSEILDFNLEVEDKSKFEFFDTFLSIKECLTDNSVSTKYDSGIEFEKFRFTGDRVALRAVFKDFQREYQRSNLRYKSDNSVHKLYNCDKSKVSGSFSQSVEAFSHLYRLAYSSIYLDYDNSYREIALDLKNEIQKWFWDDYNGLFYDIDHFGIPVHRNYELVHALALGVASDYQIRRILENLDKDQQLEEAFSNFLKDDKSLYYFVKFLNSKEHYYLAHNLVADYFRENSTQAAIQSLDYNSQLRLFALYLENVIGLEPDAGNKVLKLKLFDKQTLAISKLYFADNYIELQVKFTADRIQLDVRSSSQFYLNLFYNGKNKIFNITPDTTSYFF
ncbi:MAG: hypothetical protein JXR63_12650 [Spirochaetales bacterium]|nr:hypothetical protein [Spirochaetales bacterium]